METKTYLINHFKVIHTALEAIGGSANLDIKTFKLSVSCGEIHYNFHPQFLAFQDGKKVYTPTFSPQVKVFIGWLPYFNKRWNLSNEKLRFKAFCLKEGVPTPEYSLDGAKPMQNVLVKSNISSFGYSIRGPFASSADCELAPGEFFESFISGKILKIWFWNAQLVCVESQNMPDVVGNGKETLREILTARLEQFGRKAELDELSEFLAFMGKNLESVIPEKQRCMVDFRYGSPYYIPRTVDTWSDAAEEIQPIKPQLLAIGQKLWNGISETLRPNTLFTVDAMLDAENRVWCLEMNSNPFVHPLAYSHILDTLFAVKTTEITNGPQSQPAEPGPTLIH